MNPNKALWEKGDFTKIADTMRNSGAGLVARLGITKNIKLLDLGCGDGTTAIPAAKLGADVTGIDIAENLVAAGNARAKAAGLTNCTFKQGDACQLQGVADDSFDMLVSIFGAMFAPKPYDVAKEMVRVTKPGGKIVMGNWIPGDPTLVAQILKISSAYTPPPPEGFVSPMLWGVEAEVVDRFAAAGVSKQNIVCQKADFTFVAQCTPNEFVDLFKRYYGPTMSAFEAAGKNGKAAQLERELQALFAEKNSSNNSSITSITATYLLVEVTVS
ncbi:class I SAM-dependent methyltransferase [Mucilaginibacter ximonensis]|uniref:Class I SAM-dependent methyltransferase n=1 Tax=Mucilaginibacter ximonensis TaxID=538021 RepID=A0ABW5YDT4_9SPHI